MSELFGTYLPPSQVVEMSGVLGGSIFVLMLHIA